MGVGYMCGAFFLNEGGVGKTIWIRIKPPGISNFQSRQTREPLVLIYIWIRGKRGVG